MLMGKVTPACLGDYNPVCAESCPVGNECFEKSKAVFEKVC